MRHPVRPLLLSAALVALAACVDTRMPDSAAHLPTAPANPNAPLSAMIQGSAVSAQPLGAGAPVAGGQSAVPAVSKPAGISDEQDFQAVSARETIESDAARRAAQQAQYQQVQPTAVPKRPSGQGKSIVDYALSTSNEIGQPLYKRFTLGGKNRFRRNCAGYGSPDLAQQAFLNAGGPQKDRYGIDPDGDGFACGWNPAPFRKVRSAPAPVAAAPLATPDGAISASDLSAAGITGGVAPAVPPAAPLPGEALNISTE